MSPDQWDRMKNTTASPGRFISVNGEPRASTSEFRNRERAARRSGRMSARQQRKLRKMVRRDVG
jgi:hypothetical protein